LPGEVPPAAAPRLAELPSLRWAARCDSTQFRTSGGQVPFHAHRETELVLCTAGRVVITAGTLAIEGRPGDLYVLPPLVPHAVASGGAWENICVLFDGGPAALDPHPRTIRAGEDAYLAGWLEALWRLHDAHPRRPGIEADALLLAVLCHAAEVERSGRSMAELHPRLAAAVRYLDERPQDDVGAAELARAAGTSYSHLSALFRGRFGCAPLQYHRNRRMQRAQTLLADPYLSVGEVAFQLGFADLNYFVRTFRKTFGISPARWRKRRPGGED
jgi:AraC-like DNA-binding protein